MPEYLSTREVARYLKLNQKKVYALVKAGALPAARISGKWLFPRHLIDQWVDQHTVYPATGLLGALLDDMLILQGSDDWLLTQIIDRYQSSTDGVIPSAAVGSLAGLGALQAGRAHLASCHVEVAAVRERLREPAYLLSLFTREQGLILDRGRHRGLTSLAAVAKRRLRFAERQELSGTYRLVRRLLREAGVEPAWTPVGPYSSHVDLALAIRAGRADVGVGARIAAELCGLDFVPLATEPFELLVPAAFIGHRRMARFLDFATSELAREARRRVPGYRFDPLGRLQPLGAAPAIPMR
jgi:excisionase family DNA binding protein